MRKKLSIEEFVSYQIKTLRIHGAGGVGSNDTFDFRVWWKTNPCKGNIFHVICVEYVKRLKSSYSSLWVNGSYVTNFNSTASSGSDQRVTLGYICDGGDTQFLGTIAAMEIYVGITEGVPGPIKEEIMKMLCPEYKVDIDSSKSKLAVGC